MQYRWIVIGAGRVVVMEADNINGCAFNSNSERWGGNVGKSIVRITYA